MSQPLISVGSTGVSTQLSIDTLHHTGQESLLDGCTVSLCGYIGFLVASLLF